MIMNTYDTEELVKLIGGEITKIRTRKYVFLVNGMSIQDNITKEVKFAVFAINLRTKKTDVYLYIPIADALIATKDGKVAKALALKSEKWKRELIRILENKWKRKKSS